ncbi:MAG: translation initiation factor IF-1 [Candidatus Zambryskibacteria bacterium]|nr:translation initiation factor IF-1 [Candidatus Zambryskibacteria bacterium]
MAASKAEERTGVVVESLPNIMFKVALDTGGLVSGAGESDRPLLAYLSGKMRLHRIRVLVGDKVLLELEPYGGKARIIKRL